MDLQDLIKRSNAARYALYAIPVGVAVALALLFAGADRSGVGERTGSVQIVGSETMRPVITACAESFMARHPGSDVVVKGGGSGDGVAALLHGIADIGMASRELAPKERDFAKSKGIDLALAGVALDGVAIIAHRSSTIDALDLEQVRRIFSGRTKSWRELGGGEGEIVAVARAGGSGTAAFFAERVFGDGAEAVAARLLPTNEAIVAEVAARPGAIGYADLGAVRLAGDRVKILRLREAANAAPSGPTPEDLRSGAYPLARTLYLASAGAPSETARAFIAHCTAPTARALIERAGYVGLIQAAR